MSKTMNPIRYHDGWAVDPKTDRVLSFSRAFHFKADAQEFARKNNLSLRCVRSRRGGYVVERPDNRTD